MYDAWLALHREGRTIVRLQMNFLQNQNDPALPELKERLRNQFQFFGDDMLMTGSIGEWAAPLGSGAVWREAQRLVAQAGWRNENSVQNLAGLTQVVEAYEAVNKEFDITSLRWVVHHVPVVTADLLTRLKNAGLRRRDGRVSLGTSSDPKVVVGPPFRTIVDHGIQVGIHGDGVAHRAAESLAAHLFATTGVNSFGDKVNGDQQLTRAGGAAAVHAQEQLVSADGRQDRHDRNRQARRSRGARSRLLHGARRGDQADSIGADGGRTAESCTTPG